MVLYLASTSPRRRALLAAAGFEFAIVAPGSEPRGEGPPAERARIRARSKAVGAQPIGPPGLILGADTLVVVSGRELGKPRHRAHAAAMLEALSGREHEVITALCLAAHPGRTCIEGRASARVRCRPLARAEREAYLDTGAWRGKAGAYGIQDAAGDFMALAEGELDTVIGLPVALLRQLLVRAGDLP